MIVKKMVLVKANGKRYLFLREERNKIYACGDVVQVSGFSCTHTPDKCFLASHVTVYDGDYDEALLAELYKQGTGKELPAPKVLKVDRVIKTPKGEKVIARKKYAKINKRTGRFEITSHGRTQLWKEGKDVALDGLGNYLKREDLETAATDSAMYHMDLTDDGVPEGFNTIREIAADIIYDGMLAGEKQHRRENRSTELP